MICGRGGTAGRYEREAATDDQGRRANGGQPFFAGGFQLVHVAAPIGAGLNPD
jgi:hypothetical protein